VSAAATGGTRLSGHIAGLDGVRGLAVLLVMALHFVGDSTAHTVGQRVVTKAATFGLVGVDLFFVLSGFLITGLLVESKGRPHYFRNFYARRTLRIFPLYYFVLACLFLVLPRLMTPSPELEVARSHQAWLWTYTSNFYLAATSSWASLPYVAHFWSLAIEEHFYLVWPLVVFSFSRPTLERICLGVLVFGLVLRIALGLAGMSELSISVLTPARVDTLCVGALLAIRVRRPGELERLVGKSGRATLFLLGAVLGVLAFGAVTQLALPVVHQIRNSLYGLLFGALTLVALKRPSNLVARAFQGPVLRFFGKYSYGLYVYHGIFHGYLAEGRVEDRLDQLLGSHALAMVARAVIGLGVSLVIALASYHLLEKHFLALKRYFEAQEEPSTAPMSRPRPTISTVR
jgi:peptidoglycan/LPS O-acetylase OafA/YrhL